MNRPHRMGAPLMVSLFTGGLVFFWLFGFPVMAFERFVNNHNGTITDNQTGLMWAAQDNGSPINWMDAQSYCNAYRVGGHADWRMPTLDELAGLYEPQEKNRRGYHLSKEIETTAASCWARETDGDRAARFNFTYGTAYWLRQPYSGPTRVLPVRTPQ